MGRKSGGGRSSKSGHSGEGLRTNTETIGSHDGQIDYVSKSYTKDGKLAATLEYSVYRGVPHIDMVTSHQEGVGGASKLISELDKEYGYENIEWGMMTDSGKLFQSRMDKKYNVTRTYRSLDSGKITSKFNGTSYADNRLEFNASFSKSNYGKVEKYLRSVGATNIEIDIANNEVFITANLPEDMEVVKRKK